MRFRWYPRMLPGCPCIAASAPVKLGNMLAPAFIPDQKRTGLPEPLQDGADDAVLVTLIFTIKDLLRSPTDASDVDDLAVW
jgi:hypothetical protein